MKLAFNGQRRGSHTEQIESMGSRKGLVGTPRFTFKIMSKQKKQFGSIKHDNLGQIPEQQDIVQEVIQPRRKNLNIPEVPEQEQQENAAQEMIQPRQIPQNMKVEEQPKDDQPKTRINFDENLVSANDGDQDIEPLKLEHDSYVPLVQQDINVIMETRPIAFKFQQNHEKDRYAVVATKDKMRRIKN